MKRAITFEQLRRLVNESDEEIDKSFKPTPEWMKEKYDEMNKRLFNGELGECKLDLFTTGSGSEGRTLGKFCMNSGNTLRVETYSRQMYISSPYLSGKTYITIDNFVKFCRPTIKLNGNYTGTEHAFLGTLVHEMCHYYTYMRGYCPKQAHGREFRYIGEVISQRSGGEFTIKRLADAEQMSEYELSDEMKAKKERRMNNKKANTWAVFVWTVDGRIELLMIKPSSMNLLAEIKETCGDNEFYEKLLVSKNQSVVDYLFGKGYKHIMRSWRFWDLANKPWLSELWDLVFTDNFEWWVDKEPEKMVGEDANDSDDDSIVIPNGMNLSQESPLEQNI